jgi:hypothetical protein
VGEAIRLGKRLRIAALSKGLRVSVGPRWARVHAGAGLPPSVSTGKGPVTVWQSAGTRRRRGAGSPAVSGALGTDSAVARSGGKRAYVVVTALALLPALLPIWLLMLDLDVHRRGAWWQPLLAVVLATASFDWLLLVTVARASSGRRSPILDFLALESLLAPVGWLFYKDLAAHGRDLWWQVPVLVALCVVSFTWIVCGASQVFTGSMRAALRVNEALLVVAWLAGVGTGVYLIAQGLIGKNDTGDIGVGVAVIVLGTWFFVRMLKQLEATAAKTS